MTAPCVEHPFTPDHSKHLPPIASVTGRMQERDVLLLWITHTTGIRDTVLALRGAINPGVIASMTLLRGSRRKADPCPDVLRTRHVGGGAFPLCLWAFRRS